MKTEAAERAESTKSALRASGAIVRASDPKAKAATLGGIAMSDPASSAAAGGILAALTKLLPAAVGATVMAMVDHPKDRREFILRVLVAFAVGYYLRGPAIDFLHSFSLFSWVDKADDDHKHAVSFLLGACGWSVIGGAAMLLKKFRADPLAVVDDVKKAV